MGFQFGLIGQMEPSTGTYCFLVAIAFILISEFLISFLEHLLEGSNVYHRMVQKIYKELMLMGLISFIVIMYEADLAARDHVSATVQEWIVAIDFGHICLFFTAIFYVVHSFMLIILAGVQSKQNISMFLTPVSEIITEVKQSTTSAYQSFLYHLSYFPLCQQREVVEFKLLSTLFSTSYTLPNDFHFALYLSGCLESYALEVVELGLHTWATLGCLVVLNFIRIKMGILTQCLTSDDDDHHDDHRRFLGASADDGPVEVSHCSEMLELTLFLGCGAVVIIYVVVLLIVARYYSVKLLHEVGVNGPGDYLNFLTFSEEQRQAVVKEQGVDEYEAANKEVRGKLRKTIEALLDDDEEEDAEEALFNGIIEFCRESYLFCIKSFYDLQGYVRTSVFGTKAEVHEQMRDMGTSGRNVARRISVTESTPQKPSMSTGRNAKVARISSGTFQDAEHVTRKTMISHLTNKQPNSPSPAGRTTGPFFATGTDSAGVSTGPSETGDSDPGSSSGVASAPVESKSNTSMVTEPFEAPVKGLDNPKSEVELTTPVSLDPLSAGPMENRRLPPIAHSAQEKLRTLDNEFMSAEDLSGGRQYVVKSADISSSASSLGGDDAVSPVVLEEELAIDNMKKKLKAIPKNALPRLPPIETSNPSSPRSVTANVPLKKLRGLSMKAAALSGKETNNGGVFAALEQIRAAYAASEGERSSSGRSRAASTKQRFLSAKVASELSGSSKDVEHGNDDSSVGGDSEGDIEGVFTRIFLFGEPKWFFRAVDIGIMLHSVYLAIWATSFIFMVSQFEEDRALFQCLMIIPPIICFPCIALTIKICSQLHAIVYLDLEVVGQVLEEMEDMEELKVQLRDRVLAQIATLAPDQRHQRHLIHALFWDIDTDKSNSVDIFEFRQFLKLLRLTYSDKRFYRLFRAIDVDGDGSLGLSEVDYLIFPELYYKDLDGQLKEKVKYEIDLKPKRGRSMFIR